MITYCTNIHPGESWDEIFLNVRTHLPAVKAAVSPDAPFPIGLRLSNRAAIDLDAEASALFQEWCREAGCFVPTINGFPYGVFHGRPVKESVYLPDWRQEERVEYTKRLAYLLDAWLPEGMAGSISTVPVGFKRKVRPDDYAAVRRNLLGVLEHLDLLRQRSGKEIVLCLEPEPGCVLETTEDLVRFIEQMGFPRALGNMMGICFDCCHHAVAFENVPEAFAMLSEAGVKIGKIQASSALRLKSFDRTLLDGLDEPCYLHQVVIRHPEGRLARYDDLPEALDRHHIALGEEWRIHFHVPVFAEDTVSYGTTRFFLEECLQRMDGNIPIEVETYTWDVLPAELRSASVTESIIREIEWVKEKSHETNRRS